MRQGLLQRTCEVEIVQGVRVKLETERFINMASPNRAAVRMVVTAFGGVDVLGL